MPSPLTQDQSQTSPLASQNAPDVERIPQDNFTAATREMELTPQEQALYQRHLSNLYGPGGVDNPDRQSIDIVSDHRANRWTHLSSSNRARGVRGGPP